MTDISKLIETGDKAFILLLMFLLNPIDKKCVICHRPREKHKKTCIYGQLVQAWAEGKENNG